MNEAARIGTVWAHEEAELFFGSASYRNQDGDRVNGGLWAIDAEGESMSQVLPATPEKRVLRAAFDAHGERAFFLTYDGTLNAVDAESGDLLEAIELVEPFDGDTSPLFTTVGDLLYMTDRANGRVIEFNLDHGHVEQEWPVGGEPRSIAFAGISAGEDHEEHGHGEEGEDEHGHAHAHGEFDPHFWFDPPRVKTAVHYIAERLAGPRPCERGDVPGERRGVLGGAGRAARMDGEHREGSSRRAARACHIPRYPALLCRAVRV